jgi:two-component system, NarL family, response regulator LiaR
MDNTIRVFIADDHAIVRAGLRALISGKPDMELVGEAVDGEEAVKKVHHLRPDVILMDLMMPRKSGIEAIREIRAADPQACILVLTSFVEDEQVFPAIKAGVLGYILKDSSPEELIESIRCVHRGQSSLHPTVARKLLLTFDASTPSEPKAQILTERELDVVKLVARGLSNQAIADQLFVGEGTVRFHMNNILSKLQLENRIQVVIYALRHDLVSLPEL